MTDSLNRRFMFIEKVTHNCIICTNYAIHASELLRNLPANSAGIFIELLGSVIGKRCSVCSICARQHFIPTEYLSSTFPAPYIAVE